MMLSKSQSIWNIMQKYEMKFLTEVSDKLKCVICKSVLRNAHQTECGCKVCYVCIEEHLKDNVECPSNSVECEDYKLNLFTNIHPDNATNKDIFKLQVQCVYADCGTEVLLQDLIGHMEGCVYRLVVCSKCNNEHVYNNTEDHNKNECLQRETQCEWCKHSMTYKHFQSTNLEDNEMKVRDNLPECTKKCPYGCGAPLMNSTNLNDNDLSQINTELKIQYLNMKIINKEIIFYQTLIEQYTKLIAQMSRITENNIKRLKKQIKSSGSVKSSRLTLETLDHSRSLPVVCIDCSYIWKINNFPQKQIDSLNGSMISLTSVPFFTSEFGYKLCLRIYPSGDGEGRGNHLSVFFVIMKGDYDDILTWPFKQTVTLSLLSQEDNTKHYVRSFNPNIESACYQKPVDDYNNANGYPKFISLDMVKIGNSYCKHGNIFIKIIVDKKGISHP